MPEWIMDEEKGGLKFSYPINSGVNLTLKLALL